MRDRPEGTGGVRREGDAGERAAAVQMGERCAAPADGHGREAPFLQGFPLPWAAEKGDEAFFESP